MHANLRHALIAELRNPKTALQLHAKINCKLTTAVLNHERMVAKACAGCERSDENEGTVSVSV